MSLSTQRGSHSAELSPRGTRHPQRTWNGVGSGSGFEDTLSGAARAFAELGEDATITLLDYLRAATDMHRDCSCGAAGLGELLGRGGFGRAPSPNFSRQKQKVAGPDLLTDMCNDVKWMALLFGFMELLGGPPASAVHLCGFSSHLDVLHGFMSHVTADQVAECICAPVAFFLAGHVLTRDRGKQEAGVINQDLTVQFGASVALLGTAAAWGSVAVMGGIPSFFVDNFVQPEFAFYSFMNLLINPFMVYNTCYIAGWTMKESHRAILASSCISVAQIAAAASLHDCHPIICLVAACAALGAPHGLVHELNDARAHLHSRVMQLGRCEKTTWHLVETSWLAAGSSLVVQVGCTLGSCHPSLWMFITLDAVSKIGMCHLATKKFDVLEQSSGFHAGVFAAPADDVYERVVSLTAIAGSSVSYRPVSADDDVPGRLRTEPVEEPEPGGSL